MLGEQLGVRLAVGEEDHHVGRVDEEMAAARAAALELGLGELGAAREAPAAPIVAGEIQGFQEAAGVLAKERPADDLGGEAGLGAEALPAGVVEEGAEHQAGPPAFRTSGLA